MRLRAPFRTRPHKGTLLATLAGALSLLAAATPVSAALVLDAVRRDGLHCCSVSVGADRTSQRGRADVSCTVAVAPFCDADKVRFVSTATQSRFTALQPGEVGMLMRNTALILAQQPTEGGPLMPWLKQ